MNHDDERILMAQQSLMLFQYQHNSNKLNHTLIPLKFLRLLLQYYDKIFHQGLLFLQMIGQIYCHLVDL